MRAIAQARRSDVTVVAAVGGKAGASGGPGLMSVTCSRVVLSD